MTKLQVLPSLNFVNKLIEKSRDYFNYLVDRVSVNRVVEAGVQVVEKIDHLKGRRARGYRCETDNVRKVDRDLPKLFRVDGHAELQFFGDRTENSAPS